MELNSPTPPPPAPALPPQQHCPRSSIAPTVALPPQQHCPTVALNEVLLGVHTAAVLGVALAVLANTTHAVFVLCCRPTHRPACSRCPIEGLAGGSEEALQQEVVRRPSSRFEGQRELVKCLLQRTSAVQLLIFKN